MTCKVVLDEELKALDTSTTDVIKLIFNLCKDDIDTLYITEDSYSVLIQHPRFGLYFLHTAEVSKDMTSFKWQGIEIVAM